MPFIWPSRSSTITWVVEIPPFHVDGVRKWCHPLLGQKAGAFQSPRRGSIEEGKWVPLRELRSENTHLKPFAGRELATCRGKRRSTSGIPTPIYLWLVHRDTMRTVPRDLVMDCGLGILIAAFRLLSLHSAHGIRLYR